VVHAAIEILDADGEGALTFGEQLHALGVPAHAQFDSASALVNDVLDLAGQYAAGARLLARDTDRTAFLGMIAAEWEELDRRDCPFMHRMADGLQ
jgi:hypothetical protein